MLITARSVATLLLVASAVSAWPIYFFPTRNCRGPPAFVLKDPPKTSVCGFIPHHEPMRSYLGGTTDAIEELLLYINPETCLDDAAHRVYANYTVTNATRWESQCVMFNNTTNVPRAYVFIENFLPVPTSIGTPPNVTSRTAGAVEGDCMGNRFVLQN